MLQITSRGFNIECKKSVEGIHFYEKQAEKYAESLSAVLGEDIYLAFNGPLFSEPAAYAFYWIHATLLEGKPPGIGYAESFLYYVAGYSDEYSTLLVFNEPGGENVLFRLLSTSKATGRKPVVVSLPLPPPLVQLIDSSNGFYLEIQENCPLVYILTSFYAALAVLEKNSSPNPRVKRISGEKRVAVIYENLLTKYRASLEKALSDLSSSGSAPALIVYTPTLLGPAKMMYTLISVRKHAYLASLSEFLSKYSFYCPRVGSMYLLATTVEEDMVREAKYRVATNCKKTRLIEFVIGTDPLTAPIYLSMLLVELAPR